MHALKKISIFKILEIVFKNFIAGAPEATLTPLVNLLEDRYYDSLLLSLPGVSEERVKRILMVLLLDRQTRSRIHAHSPEGVIDRSDPKAVKEGTQFLKDLYDTLSNDDKDLFQAADQTIFDWIPKKAIYIYSFGEKKDLEIPFFFKEETRKGIEGLRKKELQPQEKDLLKNFFSSIDNSSKDPDPSIREIRNQIVGAAFNEITQGMLTLACFEQALIEITANPTTEENSWHSRFLSFFQ